MDIHFLFLQPAIGRFGGCNCSEGIFAKNPIAPGTARGSRARLGSLKLIATAAQKGLWIMNVKEAGLCDWKTGRLLGSWICSAFVYTIYLGLCKTRLSQTPVVYHYFPYQNILEWYIPFLVPPQSVHCSFLHASMLFEVVFSFQASLDRMLT